MSVTPSVFVEWAAVSAYTSGAQVLPLSQVPGVHDIGRHTARGVLTDNLPNETLSYTLTGVAGANPLDDVYGTVWVVPGELRVGSVTATTNREVEVWNAYRAPRVLDGITVSNAEGIDVTGPVLPYTFLPLENFVFAVTVSPDGPAVIDARYDFDFTTAEGTPHFTVVGQRIIQWTIAPDWAEGYEETLTYRTEIIEAFDGSEQRIATRHRPRRSLAFSPAVVAERSRRMKRLLSTWQHRNYAMADWARGVPFTGLPAGAVILTLAAPMPELTEGQLIVLRDRAADFTQAIEVASIDTDGVTVTLNSPTAEAFPGGSLAFPGLIVHADPSLSGRRLTSAVGRASLQFTEMHTAAALDVPAAPVTWRGLEVFLRRPNWATGPEDEHNFHFAWLDSGRGLFDVRNPHSAPKDIRKMTYLLRDRDAVRDLEAFFLRCRGRRGAFYMPTQDEDLVVDDDLILLEGGQALPVAEVEDADRMTEERVYRNVYMRLTDGTEIFRQVTGADLSEADDPKIGLDAGWPRTIYGHEVAKLCWLPRWRLASDELTIRWVTDEVAEATLGFQTLPDVEGA